MPGIIPRDPGKFPHPNRGALTCGMNHELSRMRPASLAEHPVHPKGSKARVLLVSVFGPYARDDEYGSRAINPMELYHNQVTRVQGGFSLRMFHRSWGLMLIQANLRAPCTLLDFPTRDRFVEEIRTQKYDVVGIGAIMPNVGKVREMCRLVREHQPGASIVVGGHVANLPGLGQQVDTDHIVRGEGISWMRRYLGEDVAAPVRHPRVLSGVGARTMGVTLADKPGDTAATLIPSVGCPLGCNFCATSAMFGGKGSSYHFYPTGDALFSVMCELERDMRVRSFFVMDENFLFHRKRALRLLELMKLKDKSWSLYVFSSANVLRSYTMEQLVGLGLSWVWMGLEGEAASYAKLHGADTRQLVRTLQENGICVLGSSIIGLEEHAPHNIEAAIEHAVSHDTEFHQFMLYTPLPGTPLHAEHKAKGTLIEEVDQADVHGQFRFNFRHPRIQAGQETEFLLRAFRRDFEVNGPSSCRMARTLLKGYQKYKDHPDPRIRRRYVWEARDMAVTYAGALWAARRFFAGNVELAARIGALQAEVVREFGWKARIAAPLVGTYLRWSLRREEARLRRGWTYEPPTFYEHSPAAV